MVEYIKVIEEKDDFPIKLKLTTPSGEFIMDVSKISGLDYSNHRKRMFEGDPLEARDDLKKKCLILNEKTFEDIMNEDFQTVMIFDKALTILLEPHEDTTNMSDHTYLEIIEKNEIFNTISRIKVKIEDETFIMNRKGIRGIDYQEQKKSMINGTYERVNQNIIMRCIEDKENFSLSKIMTKPFWFYKRLDNVKQFIMGDEKPF